MLHLVLTSLVCLADRTGSTAAADTVGRGAWFIDATEDAVLLITPRAGVERFTGCTWPSRLVVDQKGTAYVTCRGSGEVMRLEPSRPPVFFTAGAEPSALALDEERQRLYVGLTTSNTVLSLDAASGREVARVDVGMEPTTLGLYSGGLAVGSRKSNVVKVYSRWLGAAPQRLTLWTPPLDTGVPVTVSAEAFVPAREGLLLFAPRAELGDLTQPTYYASSIGAPVTQDLFVLDGQGLKRVRNLVLPEVSGAWFDAERDQLLVVSRGVGGLVSVDARSYEVALDWDLPSGAVALTGDGHSTWVLNDDRRELAVRGPRRLFPEVATSVDYGYFAPTGLTTAGARRGPPERVEHLALGGGGDRQLARGRQLFHAATDFRVSGATLSCAGCHREGRDDGRTWAGESTMRQTPMLAGRDIAHTAPYGWSGKYQTLEAYIQFTITQRMQGDGLPKKDLEALARYVREGLRPVTRGPVEHGDEVRRGRVVFNAESTGCAGCHAATDSYTDGAMHDVGSIGEQERLTLLLRPPPLDALLPFDVLLNPTNSIPGFLGKRSRSLGAPRMPLPRARYDTPSLMGLGLSAPYLHDGSAKRVEDVFVRLGDHMGKVTTLTRRERDDLSAYLRTL